MKTPIDLDNSQSIFSSPFKWFQVISGKLSGDKIGNLSP